jgi:hypothetical protein
VEVLYRVDAELTGALDLAATFAAMARHEVALLPRAWDGFDARGQIEIAGDRRVRQSMRPDPKARASRGSTRRKAGIEVVIHSALFLQQISRAPQRRTARY